MATKAEQELRKASAEGRIEQVRKLLDAGVNPNAIVDRAAALHAASAQGHVEIIEALVAAGADVDLLDKDGITPLMAASSADAKKSARSVPVLIRLGANASYVRDVDGAHALDSAVVRAAPHVIQELIRHGAPLDGRKGDPITPLMRAAVEGNLDAVKVLIASGSDPTRKCALPWGKGKTAEELALHYKKLKVASYLQSVPKT